MFPPPPSIEAMRELPEGFWKCVPLPWGSLKMMIWWAEILKVAPLKDTKMKLIMEKNDHRVTMGILVDHLVGLAKALDIPQVYINEIRGTRNHLSSFPQRSQLSSTVVSLHKETRLLLEAVHERTREVAQW